MLVVCAAVVSALEGKDCRDAMKTIAENTCIPQDRLSHVVAGMYRVLTEATRIPTSSLKQEVGGCLVRRSKCIYKINDLGLCLFRNVDITSIGLAGY